MNIFCNIVIVIGLIYIGILLARWVKAVWTRPEESKGIFWYAANTALTVGLFIAVLALVTPTVH